MPIELLGEMFVLGLGAVDAVGIAFMPILLLQPDGLRRSVVFLTGSFLSLLSLGILFSAGLGTSVVDLNKSHPWLEPGVEAISGLILLVLGIGLLIRSNRGKKLEAPETLVEKLTLPMPLLFAFGAALVAVQSLVDAVFVVAMVEAGTSTTGVVAPVVASLVYAISALLIQIAVVLAFLATSPHRREAAAAKFTDWLASNGERWSGIVAVALGIGLMAFAGPDFIAAL